MTGKRVDFKNPDSQYRGKPFWAWNGKLEEHELVRQLDVMREMGFGGAFMHSRVGLATSYLSEEWFGLINACAEHCKKNGMEAWLYDEDRWPSGAAGGLVTKNPKYRARKLIMNVYKPSEFKTTGREHAVFAGRFKGNDLLSYRRLESPKKQQVAADEKILSFEVKIDSNNSWYNGYTYLDTMSDEAVKQFIKVTHQVYAKNSNQYFGKTIPGVFTDEPNYGCVEIRAMQNELPWTEKLLSTFKKRYGYDLTDKLPEVVFRCDGEDFSKIRHDYFETCTALFAGNFAKLIFEWCEKNKLLFTGHVLAESALHTQTPMVGSAMRFYEYMQAPGIDVLCGQGLTRDGGTPAEYLTAKQCSSVLDQFGRKWMLSELYGCTGWNFTFGEHKAVGDWQVALGVNLRCQHLSWYTMEGEAKRDYPSSIFFHSPWWKDYPFVEDYFSRVNFMLTQGRSVRDVALLHTAESAWGVAYQKLSGLEKRIDTGKRKGDFGKPLHEIDRELKKVQQVLLEEHFDFDYIDESILSRYGKIKNGRFGVAKSSYSTVIVPPSYTLRRSTCDLLSKFADAGGKIIFVGRLPKYIEAEKNGELLKLVAKGQRAALNKNAIVKALSKDSRIRRVSIKTADGKEYNPCLYMMRQDKSGRTILFVCHTLQDVDSGDVFIEVPASGQVQEWDAVTGKVFLADSEKTGHGVRIRTVLHGCGSRLFVIDPKSDKSLRKNLMTRTLRRKKISCRAFDVFRDEPNAFPLDVPEYSVNGSKWKRERDVLASDNVIRDLAGWPRRGGAMCQPWTQKDSEEKDKVDVKLRYEFDVETLPSSACHLVIERPEKFTILLNGNELKREEGEGWWIDPSFQKIKVSPNLLQKGKNELLLSTRYGRKDNLEAVYFTGEFGFRWKGGTRPVIMALPTSLKIGDWCEQGFPCYTGALAYSMEVNMKPESGKRFVLEIPDWNGTLLKVHVNGRLAGRIAWKPYEVDITDYVSAGKNVLNIEMVGSRRNLLGPLHLDQKYPVWTGPYQYKQEHDWTDKYVRLPYGLTGEPVLSIRDTES